MGSYLTSWPRQRQRAQGTLIDLGIEAGGFAILVPEQRPDFGERGAAWSNWVASE